MFAFEDYLDPSQAVHELVLRIPVSGYFYSGYQGIAMGSRQALAAINSARYFVEVLCRVFEPPRLPGKKSLMDRSVLATGLLGGVVYLFFYERFPCIPSPALRMKAEYGTRVAAVVFNPPHPFGDRPEQADGLSCRLRLLIPLRRAMQNTGRKTCFLPVLIFCFAYPRLLLTHQSPAQHAPSSASQAVRWLLSPVCGRSFGMAVTVKRALVSPSV